MRRLSLLVDFTTIIRPEIVAIPKNEIETISEVKGGSGHIFMELGIVICILLVVFFIIKFISKKVKA